MEDTIIEPRQFSHPDKIKKTVAWVRESNRMLEAWTQRLDELIASVEADIRNNPINVYRRENAKQRAESVKQEL
ncbi:hypothetical protein QUA62_18915 [Microcoleus sp. MON1_C1]|uniref:hypothetical protein n=1 Tax=Microcoleus sp. MON1_C1 TaxID=2818827 RepID=UPI002FD5A179